MESIGMKQSAKVKGYTVEYQDGIYDIYQDGQKIKTIPDATPDEIYSHDIKGENGLSPRIFDDTDPFDEIQANYHDLTVYLIGEFAEMDLSDTNKVDFLTKIFRTIKDDDEKERAKIKKERAKIEKEEKEQKRKLNKIDKCVNDDGIEYINQILDKIHIGEHKNILRKILVAYSIMRGEGSFLVETVAEAGTGKSFEDEIVFNYILPDKYVWEVNDITYSAFTRQGQADPYYFNKKIVLFGDLGEEDDYKRVKDVFSVFKKLITEKRYSRSVSEADDDGGFSPEEMVLYAESVGAVYSTVINGFTGDSNQLGSRMVKFTPKEVPEDDLLHHEFMLNNPHSKQSKDRAEAIQELEDFGEYLQSKAESDFDIINPYEKVFTDFAKTAQIPVREIKQQMKLFDTYCKLTNKQCVTGYGYTWASIEQLNDYINAINLETALIPYEYDFLTMLIAKDTDRELYILSEKETDDKKTINDILDELERKRKYDIPIGLISLYGFDKRTLESQDEKIFFRQKDVKNKYRTRKAFKNINNVSQLLNTLYEKGYLCKYEEKHGRENIYYLSEKCENLTVKYDLKKADENRYIQEHYHASGMADEHLKNI